MPSLPPINPPEDEDDFAWLASVFEYDETVPLFVQLVIVKEPALNPTNPPEHEFEDEAKDTYEDCETVPTFVHSVIVKVPESFFPTNPPENETVVE